MNNAQAFQIAFQLGGHINPSFHQAFNAANSALSDTEANTNALSHSTENLQSGMSLSSKAAILGGSAIGAVAVGLGAAVVASDEYYNAMKQVQAGTGATADEMKEIKEISKNLYNNNLGEDWNDLAAAIQEVKSVTDLSGQSLETATKYAIQYRDVFGEDVTESIKASDTMMKNFGITAEQSYNLLAQGAQQGLNKSQELLDSANEYSVYFKTLGYDANEMFDVFNAGLENGAFNLDKVGDVVKEFGIRIKDGSTATSDALSYLFRSNGFDDYMDKLQNGGTATKQFMELASQVGRENAAALVKDLQSSGAASEKAYKSIEWTMGGAGQFLDALSSGALEGKDAMQQVIQKISEIGDTSIQSQMAVALFGTQAEDLEMKTLLSLGNVQDSFNMTKKTMEEIGEIKYDTIGKAIQGIGRQFETEFVIPIADRVLPYLNSFSNYLADDLSGTIQSFKDIMVTVTPIILGLSTAFLVYKGTLMGIAAGQVAYNAIQTVSIALYHAHRAAMIAYTLSGGGVKGVIAAIRASMIALNGAMLANPFILVAAALAGLVVAFIAAYKMSDTFRDKVDSAFASVRGIVSSSVSYITTLAPQLWQGFLDFTVSTFAAIRSAYDETINYFGSKASAAAEWFNGLQGPAKSVADYITGSFSTIGNTIATLSPLIGRLGLSFLGVTGPVGWVIASVISIGAFLYKLIKSNDDVRNSLLGSWELIKGTFVDAFESIKSALAPVIPILGIIGQTLLSMLMPAISEIATSFATLGPEFQKTGQIIVESFVPLGPAFAELGGAFGLLFQEFGNLFSSFATSLVPMVIDGVTTLLPVLVNLFTTWFSLTSEIASIVLPLLLGAVTSILPLIVSLIQSSLPLIVSLIGLLIPVIVDIANSVLPLLLQGAQLIFPLILAIIQAVLPLAINLISALVPVILLIAQVALPLVLQVVQMAFPLILGIIQSVLPIVTLLLEGVSFFLTNILVPAIRFLLQIVQLVFPIILGIIQLVIPAITLILQGVALLLTNIVVPAIQFLLKIVQFVFPLISTAINNGLTFVTGILKTFTSLIQGDWSGAWENIKQTAQTIMNNIIDFFKAINLYDTGKAILNGLIEGIKSMANATMSAIGGIVNGIIKGINWVLDKVGVEVSLNQWEVPQYAQGTGSHPGGLAILGDGGGPELFRTPTGFVGMSPGTDTLMNLPKGTQVIPHRETQQIMNNYNIPAYKEGTGVSNALKTGWNWVKEKGSDIKDTALDVWSYVSEPSKLMDKVLEQFGVVAPTLSGVFNDVSLGTFKLVKEKAVEFVKEKIAGFGDWSGGGSGASGDVTKWLTAAINITGVPMSWLGPLQTMAMKESGGNPRAINLWDSNAKRGTPSKGLLQTIDPTFNAYKLSGMNDIWNPIHNAVASIRYTQSRYGSIFNTPGIASMASGGGYKGYYQGGTTPNTDYYWAGERGPELLKLPGATQINSNTSSKSMLDGLLRSFMSFSSDNSGVVSVGGGGPSIEVHYAPQISVGNNESGDIREVIEKALREDKVNFKELIISVLEEYENDKDRKRLS
ncbi:phage tail tape measure protein [Niallia taxi]|uniref:phage tail tape measure protein n=1 Tax=Niallia taxi TaxID=2499688 RepID=UPI003F609A92